MKGRCHRGRCRRGAPVRRPILVGGARDPAERAAETAAAATLQGQRASLGPAPAVPVRRAGLGGAVAPGRAAAPAPAAAARAIRSLGAGRPLDAPARAFFGTRLGRDLSAVRLHEGTAADRAARALDARAFTRGSDVAFAAGERRRGGLPLLAHELAHAAAGGGAVRRKLRVLDPGDPIRRPGGKGLKQTNAKTVEDYLGDICFFGQPVVASSGEVKMPDAETCGLFRGLLGEGCACLCDIVGSRNDWRIDVRDAGDRAGSTSPHTASDTEESREGGKGSGGLVVVPSPNDRMEYGVGDVTGKIRTLEGWEIMAHELCGHARLGDKGEHPEEEAGRIRHGHEVVVEMTNRIREENDPSLTKRAADLRMPWCGESFSREKGTTDWKPSSHLPACEELRKEYLKKMRAKFPKDRRFRKKYKIDERLP